MTNKPDLFDQIASLPPTRFFRPLYRKHREALLYLFFGGLTTLLSILLFWFFTEPLKINALVANAIGWILCVLFAYLTNRTWVFTDKARDARGIFREVCYFFAGRIGTLLLEEAVLWVGIDLLGIGSMLVKVFAQVLVIVGNYYISKWFIFTSKE